MRSLLLSILILLPLVSLAADYEPLVNVPLPGGSGTASTLGDYVNAIYALSISIAALLAVIKIVIAGVKWMTTDIVTTKGDAKKDIQGAVLGLLIIVGAVIIIAIINPNIGDVDFTPPTLVTPPAITASEAAKNICDGSTYDCAIIPCSSPSKTIPGADTCINEEDKCRKKGRYGTVRQTGPNTLICETTKGPNKSGIDPGGGGVSGGGISGISTNIIVAEEGETGRATTERVVDSIPSDVIFMGTDDEDRDGEIVDTQQTRIEQNCKDQGGSNVTYVLNQFGYVYRIICY